MKKSYDSIAVIGTTAVGKTQLACHLAYEFSGEILSVDSRQVYVGMDIGTGKDFNTYEIFGQKIPYHLIDILQAGAQYNVQDFQQDFYKAWLLVQENNKLPIICGGTAFYFASLIQDLTFTQVPINLELRAQLEKLEKATLLQKLEQYKYCPFEVDVHSEKRLIRALEILNYLSNHTFTPQKKTIEINPLTVIMYLDAEERRKRIVNRLKERIAAGMIEEVEHLMQKGLTEEQLRYYGLEYKYVVNYLKGLLTKDAFELQLTAAIYRFSKQQTLYFKKIEKEGLKVHWLDAQKTLKEQLNEVESLWNN